LGFGVLDEGLDVRGATPYAVLAVSVAAMLVSMTALARAEERIVDAPRAD
jgi:hypothetical protein